jgi:hypothetical protein
MKPPDRATTKRANFGDGEEPTTKSAARDHSVEALWGLPGL